MSHRGHAQRVVFQNGFNISIQAGAHNYCNPRSDNIYNEDNFWSTFELGFPSYELPELMEYAEDPTQPTKTVYGYVPKHVIKDTLSSFGKYYSSSSTQGKLLMLVGRTISHQKNLGII